MTASGTTDEFAAGLLSELGEFEDKVDLQILIASVHADETQAGKILKAAAAKGLRLSESHDLDDITAERDVVVVEPGDADTPVSGRVYLEDGEIVRASLAIGGGPPLDLEGAAVNRALAGQQPSAESLAPAGTGEAPGPHPAGEEPGPASRAATVPDGPPPHDVPDALAAAEPAAAGPFTSRIRIEISGGKTIITGTDFDLDKELRETVLKPAGFRWQKRKGYWEYKGPAADKDDNIASVREALARLDAEAPAPAAGGFTPTPQQQAIIDAFLEGKNIAVQALAGTGKTATLVLLAQAMMERSPDVRIVYTAFNSAIVADAKGGKFGRNVTPSTMHSLARQDLMQTGFADKIEHADKGARWPEEWAEVLGIPEATATGDGDAAVSAEHVARMVIATVRKFRESADAEVGPQHLPCPPGSPLGKAVLSYARKAWADISTTATAGRLKEGKALRVDFDDYLKVWALTRPKINAGVIFFDEAQDVNDVMRRVILDQPEETQIVVVGDSHQSIYGFRGAIDALKDWPADVVLPLTQSWRFGQEAADFGNLFLRSLGSELELEGNPALNTPVGSVDEPDAILCRTNATAVAEVFAGLESGKRTALAGGGQAISQIAKAARDLKAGRGTKHPDLSRFADWDEVQHYADHDEDGKSLQVFVRLVDRYGPDGLESMVSRLTDEGDKKNPPQLTVSTAHKSKGLQWDKVRCAGDFRGPVTDPETGEVTWPSPEERRLSYVAVTRARKRIDPGSSLTWIRTHIANRGLTPEPVRPVTHTPDAGQEPAPGAVAPPDGASETPSHTASDDSRQDAAPLDPGPASTAGPSARKNTPAADRTPESGPAQAAEESANITGLLNTVNAGDTTQKIFQRAVDAGLRLRLKSDKPDDGLWEVHVDGQSEDSLFGIIYVRPGKGTIRHAILRHRRSGNDLPYEGIPEVRQAIRRYAAGEEVEIPGARAPDPAELASTAAPAEAPEPSDARPQQGQDAAQVPHDHTADGDGAPLPEGPQFPTSNDLAAAFQAITSASPAAAFDIAGFIAEQIPAPVRSHDLTGFPGPFTGWAKDGLHFAAGSPSRESTVSWEQAHRWIDTGMTGGDLKILRAAQGVVEYSSIWGLWAQGSVRESGFRKIADQAGHIISDCVRRAADAAAAEYGPDVPVPADPPPDGSYRYEGTVLTPEHEEILAAVQKLKDSAQSIHKDIFRKRPVTGTDLAFALRTLSAGEFAALLDGGKQPVAPERGNYSRRQPGEPDAGASQTIEFPAGAGIKIDIQSPEGRRAETVSWSRISNWIASAVTPRQADILKETARLDAAYSGLRKRWSTETDSSRHWGQASSELRRIGEDIIQRITDAAVGIHGTGPLPPLRDRPSVPEGSAPLFSVDPSSHADETGLSAAEDRLAQLASALPDKQSRDQPLSRAEADEAPSEAASGPEQEALPNSPGPGNTPTEPGPAETVPAGEPDSPGNRPSQRVNGFSPVTRSPAASSSTAGPLLDSDLPAVLGFLGAEDFIALVLADEGIPEFRVKKFSGSIEDENRTAFGFDAVATDSGLSVHVAHQGNIAARGTAFDWNQIQGTLDARLTPELREFVAAARTAMTRRERSADPHDREVVTNVSALVLEVRDALLAGESALLDADLLQRLLAQVTASPPPAESAGNAAVDDRLPQPEDAAHRPGDDAGEERQELPGRPAPADLDAQDEPAQANSGPGGAGLEDHSAETRNNMADSITSTQLPPGSIPADTSADPGPEHTTVVPGDDSTASPDHGTEPEVHPEADRGEAEESAAADETPGQPGAADRQAGQQPEAEDAAGLSGEQTGVPGPGWRVIAGWPPPDTLGSEPEAGRGSGPDQTRSSADSAAAQPAAAGPPAGGAAAAEDVEVVRGQAFDEAKARQDPIARMAARYLLPGDVVGFAAAEPDTVSGVWAVTSVTPNAETGGVSVALGLTDGGAPEDLRRLAAQAGQDPVNGTVVWEFGADSEVFVSTRARHPIEHADIATSTVDRAGSLSDAAGNPQPTAEAVTAGEPASQQEPGPLVDPLTGSAELGDGVTVMTGTFSEAEVEAVAAAARARQAPAEQLPVAGEVVGRSRQIGSGPLTVHDLPGNAVLGSGPRPERVAFRGGVPLEFGWLQAAGPGQGTGVRRGVADGVVFDALHGVLQAIDVGEEEPVVVPLADVRPAGTDPYAGLSPAQQARALLFDTAEAQGRYFATLDAAQVEAGDVIVMGVPGSGSGPWSVLEARDREDGSLDIKVGPVGGSGRGRRFRAGARDPLAVRLPERHPAASTSAGAALFAAWSPPPAADIRVGARDPLAGQRLTREMKTEIRGIAERAETMPELLAELDSWLTQQLPPGSRPGQGVPGQGVARAFAGMEQDAAEASRRSPWLRGSRTWQLAVKVCGKAARWIGSVGEGAMRLPGVRRVCSVIAEAVGTVAFAAVRRLPEGKARRAADRLGNRATEVVAREIGWLKKGERLPDGIYSTADGVGGSPTRRADVAHQVRDISRETGQEMQLRDLVSAHAFEAGLTPVPKDRRTRVPDWRVRNAMRGSAQQRGGRKSA